MPARRRGGGQRGNLYVADTINNRVLEYNQPFVQAMSTGFAANVVFGQGGSFTQTACAQTATGLCSPQGVASDSSDNLYVADAGNNRVLAIQPCAAARPRSSSLDKARPVPTSPTMIATSARALPPLNGMCNPLSVAVDGLGNLYVGDDGDHRVLE